MIFRSILTAAPMYLVWLVAIVVAALRWSKQPKASMWVAIGAAVGFFGALLFLALDWIVPAVMRAAGVYGYYWVYSVLGFGHSLVTALGIGLLVFAAYVGRPDEA